MKALAYTAGIAHPQADAISIAIGDMADAVFPYSVDILLLKNGRQLMEPIAEFAPWWNQGNYAYVPLHIYATFLNNYGDIR